MKKQQYDIFISYRRNGGAQYARILQLMLIQRGYSVFLDYDELTDGIFGEHIVKAIKDAPVFMLVLSPHALERCRNEGDWVRKEIELAIAEGKKIIPVNPDNSFDGNIPEYASEAIRRAMSTQYSEISFGQTLGVTIDFMIEKRIVPIVGKRSAEREVDMDYNAAKESLEKKDAHRRNMKWLGIIVTVVLLLAVLAAVSFWGRFQWQNKRNANDRNARTEMCANLETTYKCFNMHICSDLTMRQLEAIDDILEKMSVVIDDTLWMSRFECSVGQWYGILDKQDGGSKDNMPMSEVSFGEVYMLFLDTLNKMTAMEGYMFDLPSAEEWTYAAHGGSHREETSWVGSNVVDEVAWYQGNSGGKSHPCDGQQGKTCNQLDLFDMSGNVGEWCNSPMISEEGVVLRAVCGGNYNSPSADVTADSKVGMDANAKEKTVGFRVVIRKTN